jgi:cytochrome b involved in lipid metabolism
MAVKKHWLTALVVLIFVGGGLATVIFNESKPLVGSQEVATVDSTGSYSMSEVAAHADSSDCWTTIENRIYDLTDYVSKHPGGSKAILSICGEDGTSSFNSMPAGVMAAARLALTPFKVGNLE